MMLLTGVTGMLMWVLSRKQKKDAARSEPTAAR